MTATFTDSPQFHKIFDAYLRCQNTSTFPMERAKQALGYIPHTDYQDTYHQAVDKYCPMRALATVETIKDRDISVWVSSPTLGAYWLDENQEIGKTDIATDFTQYRISPTKVCALASIDDFFLADKNIDVQPVIATASGKAIGLEMNQAITKGNTEMGIKGLTTYGERAVSEALDYTGVLTTYFNLDPLHRMDATWVMNDSTALQLAQVATPAGIPLLDFEAMRMLGRPIVLNPAMDDATKGKTALMLINPAHLRIFDIGTPVVKVLSELYAKMGQTAYLTTHRTSITLERPEALSLLTIK